MKAHFLLLPAFSTLFLACPQERVTDAGSTSTDAGISRSDAGVLTTDAGQTPLDSGTTTSLDAGPRTTDAGGENADSGTTSFDAGAIGSDAGTVERAANRFVGKMGTDVGDCSVNPCLTLAYAGNQMQSGEVLEIADGVYDEALDTQTFPLGSPNDDTEIRAENEGFVDVTGGLSLYANQDFYQTYRGLRFVSAAGVGVAGGNVSFKKVSFVGGPSVGNAASFAIGTNDFAPGAWDILCEDCLLYGLGGRYSALVYRAERVVFRRMVARKDGGWGLGSAAATEFEPEGGIVFYESSDSLCSQCVVFDSLKESHQSAEALGALVMNSHEADLFNNVAFSDCVVVNNAYSGVTFEGLGAIVDGRLTNTLVAQNTGNGITANISPASLVFENVTARDNGGDGAASYANAAISVLNSQFVGNSGEALRNISGATDGAGVQLSVAGFDEARVQREFCAGITRGFCSSALSFSEYLSSFR